MAILKREHMYVWTWVERMSGLSDRFGIPEEKLFEACKVMDVPLPPASHYEHGAKVEDLPPPLPPHSGQKEFHVDAGNNEDLVEQYMQQPLPELTTPRTKRKTRKPISSATSTKAPITSTRSSAQASTAIAQEKQKRVPRAPPALRQSRSAMSSQTPIVEPASVKPPPRMMPLIAWAEMWFGEYKPHRNTLLRWIHEGRIQPQPMKIGKGYMVMREAVYRPD